MIKTMAGKRKIDRFFEDDMYTQGTRIYINTFYNIEKYKKHSYELEEYNVITIPPKETPDEIKEIEKLDLITYLLFSYLNEYIDLDLHDYMLQIKLNNQSEEKIKDLIEYLFKKGLITFTIEKGDKFIIENIPYNSDFFNGNAVGNFTKVE